MFIKSRMSQSAPAFGVRKTLNKHTPSSHIYLLQTLLALCLGSFRFSVFVLSGLSAMLLPLFDRSQLEIAQEVQRALSAMSLRFHRLYKAISLDQGMV